MNIYTSKKKKIFEAHWAQIAFCNNNEIFKNLLR